MISVNRPDIPNESPPQEGKRAGSVGRTLPGIAVRIVDPDTMEPKAPGEEGLLLVKGPSQLTGYWNDPKRRRKRMRDGYYITGTSRALTRTASSSLPDAFRASARSAARWCRICASKRPSVSIARAW